MVKVVVFLAAAAGALNFGSKPTTAGTTPAAFKPAFGNPAQIAQRAAARLAKQEECKKDLIPTPGRFLFAVGNYGAGDYFDDGLTVLERNQIASGKESFLTGGAKAAYRARTGQF